MRRRTSRRNIVVHNYRDMQMSRSSSTCENENVSQAETQIATPAPAPAPEELPVETSDNDPPMEDGVVQCKNCRMRFTQTQAAESAHNRHHPSCSSFDRNKDCDPTLLRFECILRWIQSLKVTDLKVQLKLYYQKISGKKVTCL